MRLGIVHTTLGGGSLEQALQTAAALGFEGVEVHYNDRNERRTLSRKGHAGELRALAETHGLAISGLTLGCLCDGPALLGKPLEVAGAQQVITEALSVAAEAGASVLIIPFFGRHAIELEDDLNRAAEALLELVEPAEDAGVLLAIESALNFSQMRFLLNCLGTDSAAICLDTGNAMARKLDVATGIRELGPGAINHVHLKDVRMVEGMPPDFVPVLGEGDVDFRAVAHALQAVQYDGWAVLEAPPGEDPPAGAKANLSYVRAIFGAPAGPEGG